LASFFYVILADGSQKVTGSHQSLVALLVPDEELDCFDFKEISCLAFYPGLVAPPSGDGSPITWLSD